MRQISMTKPNSKSITLTAQSNMITLAKYNFNVYEKRILFAIVDSVSPYLKTELETKRKGIEALYQKGLFDIDDILYRAADIDIPQNFDRLRKALKTLQSKQIIIELENEEIGTSPVLKYKFGTRDQYIKLSVDRELYQFLFDLSKGYTLYQFKVAIGLKSVYAMRIYELLAKWRGKPKFQITLEELRKFTGTTEKFKKIADFKRKVLDEAQKHLDASEITDLRFSYEYIKAGRTVVGFEIYVYKTDNSHEYANSMEKYQLSLGWFISKNLEQEFERLGINLKGKSLDKVKEWVNFYNKGEDSMVGRLRFFEQKAEHKFVENVAGYIMKCIENELKME